MKQPKYRIWPNVSMSSRYFVIERKTLWWWSPVTTEKTLEAAENTVQFLKQKVTEL
jgi:hypothetical protein